MGLALSKKELEIIISQLGGFSNPKVKLEQYRTDATIAADLLWNAKLNRHITGKIVADLGSGPGIFGLGAAVLGAKKVYLVDIDKEVLAVAKSNIKKIEKILGKTVNVEVLNINVKDFTEKSVQVVVQNPPFGVKKSHTDKIFLVKAMELANVVYSFHKSSTKDFIEKCVGDNGFKVKKFYKYQFPIKKIFLFHFKNVKLIDVGCWCIVKK
jgi:putative methylase